MSEGTLGRASIIIGADARPFEQETERATREVGQASGRSFTAAFGSVLLKGAKVAGTGIAAVLGTSFVKGFQRLTAIDDAKAKLKGLGYSAKDVTAIMNNALTSVKGTSFGLGEAAGAAANLVASGIKPGKELTRTLKLMGDTASIAGVGMDEMTGIFQDVAIAGTLTGESLQSLSDAGIPVVAFLSKSLHRSMGQVQKDISDGKITFNQFQTAMEQGLGGAALAAGDSFTGAMKNVSAALGRFGAAILGPAFKALPGLFADAIKWLDELTPAATRAGTAIGQQFVKVGPILREIVGSIRAFFAAFAAGDHDITSSGLPGLFEELGYWVRQVYNVLSALLVPTMGALAGATREVVAYFSEHSTQAKILVGVMTALYAITLAHSTVLAYQASAGLLTYLKGLTLVTNLTKIWTAVQWALNLALNANPISLIVIGLVALGAALVIAYKKSDTFRAIVDNAWRVVKNAAKSAVEWITQTAVPWLVGAWNTISSGVVSMKNTAVSAWNVVWSTLRAVGAWINTVFGPTFRTFKAIVEFVFKAIQILILAWWKLGVLPIFNLVKAGLSLLGAAFTSFWKNKIVPVFNGIRAVISATWNSGIRPVFEAIKAGLASLAARFSRFWRSEISPIMAGVGAVIRTVWNSTINPVFSALKVGVGRVKDAFASSVNGIKGQWDRLRGIASAPVKFMIQTVLNGGLIKAFNWLGSKVGGPHINNIPLPFAQGGVTPGYTPGRDVHQFYSPTGGRLALSGGEAIMRPEFTRAVGGKSGVNRLNKLARRGALDGDFANGGVLGNHSYFGGGVVDWIKKQPGNAFDWVGDKASSIFRGMTDPIDFLKSRMPKIPGSGVVKDLASASAEKLLGSAASKVKSLFGEFTKGYSSVGGGPIFAKMKSWIMDHLGIPYLWGGTGPRYDCSGFTQAASRAGGVSIPRTAAMQQAASRRVAGSVAKPGDLAFSGTPAHHVMMYIGGGKYAEAPHTGDVTKIIGLGSGYFTNFGRTFAKGGIFDAGTFDSGGTLKPGMNLVRNGTGADERLVPSAPASGDTYIDVTVSVDDLKKMNDVGDFLDMLNNSRTNGRKTRRSGRVTS